MGIKLDARQIISRDFLERLASASGSELDNLLRSINYETTPPFQLKASSTPNLVINVDSSIVSNTETGRNHTLPAFSIGVPKLSSGTGTITLPASSGGTITVSPGVNSTLTLSSGNYLALLIYLDGANNLNVLAGAEAATASAARDALLPAPDSTLPIGFVIVRNLGGTIQNITNSDIYQFTGVGGGAGGSGSGTANPSPAPGYKWLEYDNFTVNKTDSSSKVENTNYTNATYSTVKKIYQMNVDKTKTVAVGTTASAIVLNSAPSGFAAGDIIFYNKYKRRSVAVGSGTNSIAYSDNEGQSWTGIGTSIFSTAGQGVAWNGTRFVAVGQGTNTIAHSLDGITWTGLGTSIFSAAGFGVIWDGTKFVAVGQGTNTIAWSNDGITWTGLGTSIFSAQGTRLAFNGSRFVAVGIGTNTLAYSNDGITWTGLGTSVFSILGSDAAWGNGIWVATGNGASNTMAYSYDGITWTGLGTSLFNNQTYGLAFDGLKFIASGYNTPTTYDLAYSSDGINWTGATSDIGLGTTVCYGLSFNGNNWLAQRAGGTQYYSKDGYSWTLATGSVFSTNAIHSVSTTAPYRVPAINTLLSVTSNSAAGEWRRITSIAGSTVNVDQPFSTTPTTGNSVTLSQAVWTKDLTNFGSATERTRARDFYSGKILNCVIDYNDSLVANDDASDKTYLNRVMVSSSNSGYITDSSLPTSDKYRALYTRPIRAESISQHTLYTNTSQERLFLTFFADPYNPDVTTTCNLLNYAVSFYGDEVTVNSGILEDALCFSDNSTTPHNCSVSTSGGQTSVVLNWSYTPNIRLGESQVEVFVDGKRINKFISSAITPSTDLYWYEQTTGGVYNKIAFSADLSSTPLEIKIVKRFGILIDSVSSIVARLSPIYDAIVGTPSQVLAGQASHYTLTDAITAVSAQSKILVLNGTFTENVTVNKEVTIEGKGRGSIINGTMTFTSTSDYSLVTKLRVAGNVTFNSGADGIFFRNIFIANGITITDNGIANSKLVIME